MARFANKEAGFDSGGAIVYAGTRTFDGELKFSFEKSLTYPAGLFVTAQFLTLELITAELLQKMSARFEEVAKHFDIHLQMKTPGEVAMRS